MDSTRKRGWFSMADSSHLFFNTERTAFQFDGTLKNIVWYLDGLGARKFYEGKQVIAPAYNSPKNPVLTLDKVQLGDGYEQVTLAGINPVQQVFDLSFAKRRRVIAVAMDRFFRGEPLGSIYYRDPSQWFWWLPPYPLAQENSQPIKVRCEKWSAVPVEWDSVNVTAQFIESFEPG